MYPVSHVKVFSGSIRVNNTFYKDSYILPLSWMLLNVILNLYPFEVEGLSRYRLLGFVVGCIWGCRFDSLGLIRPTRREHSSAYLCSSPLSVNNCAQLMLSVYCIRRNINLILSYLINISQLLRWLWRHCQCNMHDERELRKLVRFM